MTSHHISRPPPWRPAPPQRRPVRALLLPHLLLLLLLLSPPWPPSCHARRRRLEDSDLVIVSGTCSSRLELAHATGRAARSPTNATSLRVVYVLENPALAAQLQQRLGGELQETYLHWPDRPDPVRPGDTRVALAPWLAHRALGDTYKWLLYGDDDTLFFVEGVKTLLRDYDPNMPYIVTDALWHKKQRNQMEAPRCLPCHVSAAYREALVTRPDPGVPQGGAQPPTTSRGNGNVSSGGGGGGDVPPVFHQPPVPPAGCPCTPELACEYTLNVTGLSEAARQRVRPLVWSPESKTWGFPRHYPTQCDYPTFHGGSGVLISVGAMRQVSYDDAMRCFYDDVEKRWAEPGSFKALEHGDRMLSLCFWMHGLALTDPGMSLSQRQTTYVGGRVMESRTAHVGSLEAAISGELPNAWWMWSILFMPAVHVRHSPGAIDVIWKLAELYAPARRAAVRALRRLGLWGRGELDAQTATGGLTWVKGAWVLGEESAGQGQREGGGAHGAAGKPVGRVEDTGREGGVGGGGRGGQGQGKGEGERVEEGMHAQEGGGREEGEGEDGMSGAGRRDDAEDMER